jgi:hypothetical protein
MDPAPDVRDVVTDLHAQEVDTRRPWQVSDAMAGVVKGALDKDIFARPRKALVLKTLLDEAVEKGGSTEYDIVLSYSPADEAEARRLHAMLLSNGRPVGRAKEQLSVHLADPNDDVDDSLGRTTCFVPIISAATLARMAAHDAADPAADIMLVRCQLAIALSRSGLAEIVPVLFGDDGTGEAFRVRAPAPGDAVSRATTAAVAETIASLTRTPRLRATTLTVTREDLSFAKVMGRVLSSPSAVKVHDAEGGDSEASCAEKLIVQASRPRELLRHASSRRSTALSWST